MISPDCRKIVTLGYDRIIHVRKFETRELLLRLDQTSEKGDFVFSFDSSQMAFNNSTSISVWNLTQVQEIILIKGKYSCLTFSKQSYLLAIVGRMDYCLEIYFGTKKLFEEPLKISEREIYTIDFAYDNTLICAGGADGKISIWNISDAKPPTKPIVETLIDGCIITKLIFSSKETHIIGGTHDCKVLLWDKKPESEVIMLTGHKTSIAHLLCSPDQTRFVTISSAHNMLIWNFEDHTVIKEIIHKYAITSISALDEKKFVMSGVDHTILTWEYESGNVLDEPEIFYGEDEGVEMMVSKYVTNPDGGMIAKYHPSPKNMITYWETSTGEILGKMPLSSNLEVSTMCFSQDGNWLALASNEFVLVYDVKQPEKLVFGPWKAGSIKKEQENALQRSISKIVTKNLSKLINPAEKEKHCIKTVAFLKNRILCAGDEAGSLTVWENIDTPDPQVRVSKLHSSSITSIAQSPDESLIATGSLYGSVRVWKLATLKTDFNTLDRHKDSINCLIFLDQNKLVTACSKGLIMLWKLKDLELSISFPSNPKLVMIPTFLNTSGDSDFLLVGYESGEIIVWNFTGVAGRPEVFYYYETYDSRILTAIIKAAEKQTAVLKTVSVSHMKKIILWSINSVKTFQIKNAKEITSDGNYIFSVLSPDYVAGSLSPKKKKKELKRKVTTLKYWYIRISDGVTGKQMNNELKGHQDEILFLKCSKDNTLLLSGDIKGVIYLWDIENARVFKGPMENPSSAKVGKFSSDGLRFAIGEGDGNFSVWETRAGRRRFRIKAHESDIVSIDYTDRSEIESLWVTGGKDLKVILWDAVLDVKVFTFVDVFEDSIINVYFWENALFVAGADYTREDIKRWDLDDQGWFTQNQEFKERTLLNSYNMCPIECHDKILTYYHDNKNLFYMMILDKDLIQNDQNIIVENPISKEEGEAPLYNAWVNNNDLVCFFDNRVIIYKNLFRNEELFLNRMLEICEFSQRPTDPRLANKLEAICSGQTGVVFPFMYNLLQAIAYTDDTSDDSNLLDTIFELLEEQKKVISLDVFFEKDIHNRNIFDIIFVKKNAELLKTLIDYIIEKYPVIETKEQAKMFSYFTVKKLNEMFHIFQNDPTTMGNLLNYLFNKPVNFPKNYVYPALNEPFYTELSEYQINTLQLEKILKTHTNNAKKVADKNDSGNEIVQARCLYIPELLANFMVNMETREFWKKVSNFDSSNGIFGNYTLMKVLEYKWLYKWKNYGKKIFFIEALYFLLFLVVFVANSSYIFKYRIKAEIKYNAVISDNIYIQTSFVLDIGLLIFMIHHIYGEVIQCLHFTFKEYFESIWNYFDVILIFLSVPAIIVDLFDCLGLLSSTTELKVMNSLTIFFGFLRLISYARGIDGSAFMVRLIIQVIIDMKYFLLFMFVFILGLGFSGFELESDFDITHFHAFDTFFTEMLGDTTDLWDLNPVNYYVLYIIFVIASIILVITLLNLLISIISETFGAVKNNEKFTRIYERWNIQTEIDVNLDKDDDENDEPKYLIYLYNEKHQEKESEKNDQIKVNLEKNQKACMKLMDNVESFYEELNENLKESGIWMKDNFKKFTEDEARKKK